MARKVPDDKRGKKKPSASATRSPGGGEAARRKAATAYTKSPVGQARSPKGRAKRKRNEMIAGAALSLIPAAGAAAKGVRVVGAARNAKRAKELLNPSAKALKRSARIEARTGGKFDKVEKDFIKWEAKQTQKSSKNFNKEVRRMIEKETKKNYKSESSRIKSTIRENKNNPGYNARQKDIDKAYKQELKGELKDLKGKTMSADSAYRRAGHYYLRAGHPRYTKSRIALEMGIKKSQAAKAMAGAKGPATAGAVAVATGAGGYAEGRSDEKRKNAPSTRGTTKSKPAPRKPSQAPLRSKARPAPRKPNQTPLRNRAKPLPRKPY